MDNGATTLCFRATIGDGIFAFFIVFFEDREKNQDFKLQPVLIYGCRSLLSTRQVRDRMLARRRFARGGWFSGAQMRLLTSVKAGRYAPMNPLSGPISQEEPTKRKIQMMEKTEKVGLSILMKTLHVRKLSVLSCARREGRGRNSRLLSWAIFHLEGPPRGVLHKEYLLSTGGTAAVGVRPLVRDGLLPSSS